MSLEFALKAGEALIEAKAQVEHGKWLPWLEKNFEASERHAERYMKLARNSTRVSNLMDQEPDLAIRSALLRYVGESKMKDVADVIGVSQPTLRKRITEAATAQNENPFNLRTQDQKREDVREFLADNPGTSSRAVA